MPLYVRISDRPDPSFNACVVVMFALPVKLPTTPTDSAETWADPPTVSAVALSELSYRLQPLSAMFVVPCPVVAPLACGLSDSTHPRPSTLDIALECTARLRLEKPMIPINLVVTTPVADMLTA